MTSSPDPLGMPQDRPLTVTPVKPRKITTPRKALSDASGNVRLQDFYLETPPGSRYMSSSPNKSSAKTENQLSPWRIRVTVEAEREGRKNGSPPKKSLPTKVFTQHTTTTTVPLKGADGSSPAAAKKTGGRPRKSLDAPINRNGTPKPKAARKRKTMRVSMEGEEDSQATPPRAGRGRPRKSLEVAVEQSGIQVEKGDAAERTPTRPRSKGRRKAMTPIRFEGNSEHTSSDGHSVGLDTGVAESSRDSSKDLEVVSPPRRRSTHKSLEKTQTADAQSGSKDAESKEDRGLVGGLANFEDYRFEGASLEQSLAEQHDEDMWRSMIRRDSRSPAGRKSVTHSDNEDNQSEVVAEELILDPTDEHAEYDSILESEGFSMVSVSSLPSARQHSSSPTGPTEEEKHEPSEIPETGAREELQSLTSTGAAQASSETVENPMQGSFTSGVNESISQIPSSPPVPSLIQVQTAGQRQTPPIVLSSPALPPPLASPQPRRSPRIVDKPTDGTPKLVRVVRAGIALQGVLSPKRNWKPTSGRIPTPAAKASSSTSCAKSPKERLDDLFSGFGAGTRRELRAGLRLGEELAKRQQAAGRKKKSKPMPDDDVFSEEAGPSYPTLPSSSVKEGYSLRLPDSGQIVEYPVLANNQLPSPARSEQDDEDRMSWKADTPVRLEVPISATTQIGPDVGNPLGNDSVFDDTMVRREAEWQREREAVSKEIEMASASQVIVIDSDEEEDEQPEEVEDEDEDIWQTEALSSDAIQEPTPKRLEDLFPNEVVKPRRAKLPSPWRRNSQVVYSDEVMPNEDTIQSDKATPDEADLFWQPDAEAAKAAKNREERRKQKKQNQASSTVSGLTDSSIDASETELASKARQSSMEVFLQSRIRVKGKTNDENFPDDSPTGNVAAPFEKYKASILHSAPSEQRSVFDDSHAYSEIDDIESSSETFEIDGPSRNFDGYSEHDLTRTSEFDEEQTELTLTGDDSVDEVISEQFSTNPVEETMCPDLRRQAMINSAQKQPKQSFQPQLSQQPAVVPEPAPSSWLTGLSSYIPLWGTSTASTTTHRAKPKQPAFLSLYQPWETAHFDYLYPLYRRQLHHPHTYPFSPTSPSAPYLNTTIPIRGWEKPFTKDDCAVADAFMRILTKRGQRDAMAMLRGEGKIEVADVMEALMRLWMGGVQRGEARIGDGTTGLQSFTDRMWQGEMIGKPGRKNCGRCKISESKCECWREGFL